MVALIGEMLLRGFHPAQRAVESILPPAQMQIGDEARAKDDQPRDPYANDPSVPSGHSVPA